MYLVLLSFSIQVFQPRYRFVCVSASAARLCSCSVANPSLGRHSQAGRSMGERQNYPPPLFSQNNYCLFCCAFLWSHAAIWFCINKSLLDVIIILVSTILWLMLSKFPPGKLWFYSTHVFLNVQLSGLILLIFKFWFLLKSMGQTKQKMQPALKGWHYLKSWQHDMYQNFPIYFWLTLLL